MPTMTLPRPEELPAVHTALCAWQREDAPLQLHPGDVGWHHLRGAEATAAHLRRWHHGQRTLAIGLLDGPGLLRLALDPDLLGDRALAGTLARDIGDPGGAVLPAGQAAVEARGATALREALAADGWTEGDPWVPLQQDLTDPPEPWGSPGLTVEDVSAGGIAEFAAVHRAAFDSEGVTEERVRAMRAGPAARDAVSLLGRDRAGVAVALITVWPAGPGRPGLIEPLGTHPAHRGHGYGRAMCRAAAARLRALDASSAVVCTPRSLPAAVATYVAAGFRPLADVPDLERS